MHRVAKIADETIMWLREEHQFNTSGHVVGPTLTR
jgi:hypothetical protein